MRSDISNMSPKSSNVREMTSKSSLEPIRKSKKLYAHPISISASKFCYKTPSRGHFWGILSKIENFENPKIRKKRKICGFSISLLVR